MTTTDRASNATPGTTRGGIALVLALSLLTIGCGDDGVTDPGETGVPEARLTFLQPADTAPPLLTTDTSVVATRGQQLDLQIFYEDPDDPGQPGDRFLRFELDEESLLRYPEDHPREGALFGPGDTVTIHVRVAGDTLLADFGPDGLQFSPDRPAELRIRYAEADRDTDGDGEDEEDFEDEVDLWRQEAPGEDWFRIGRLKDFDLDEIEADLESFTRFAAAI